MNDRPGSSPPPSEPFTRTGNQARKDVSWSTAASTAMQGRRPPSPLYSPRAASNRPGPAMAAAWGSAMSTSAPRPSSFCAPAISTPPPLNYIAEAATAVLDKLLPARPAPRTSRHPGQGRRRGTCRHPPPRPVKRFQSVFSWPTISGWHLFPTLRGSGPPQVRIPVTFLRRPFL